MNRRLFLSSMLALIAAPAVVRASSLMPGRGIILSSGTSLFGPPLWHDANGIRYMLEPDALQAAVDSAFTDGIRELWLKPGVTYPMPHELRISGPIKVTGYGARIEAHHDEAMVHLLPGVEGVHLQGITFDGRGDNPMLRLS